MNPITRQSIAALAVMAAVVAGCGSDDNGGTASPGTEAPTTTAKGTASDDTDQLGDVLEVAAREGDLNTFLAALEAADIMDGLHGEGPFTVFVPTDAAFGAYLDKAGMSQAALFADPALLRKVLDYHVVNMSETSEQVMEMAGRSFPTAGGVALNVSVDGETVMVGNATVERYDVRASNGVIHVIDDVLVPPGG